MTWERTFSCDCHNFRTKSFLWLSWLENEIFPVIILTWERNISCDWWLSRRENDIFLVVVMTWERNLSCDCHDLRTKPFLWLSWLEYEIVPVMSCLENENFSVMTWERSLSCDCHTVIVMSWERNLSCDCHNLRTKTILLSVSLLIIDVHCMCYLMNWFRIVPDFYRFQIQRTRTCEYVYHGIYV